MKSKIFALFIILFAQQTLLSGQESAQSNSTLSNHTSQEELSQWAAELDYTKTKKVIKPITAESTKRKRATPGAGFLGQIMYYALIILIIIIVLVIIIYFFSNIEDTRKVEAKAEEEIQDIEDIHNMNFDELLQQALSKNNYRQAIRIQFLILLKSLSDKQQISWSLEKTNRDYKRELRSKPFSPNFNQIVSLFERTWYGNNPLSQLEYQENAHAIQGLIDFTDQYSTANEE